MSIARPFRGAETPRSQSEFPQRCWDAFERYATAELPLAGLILFWSNKSNSQLLLDHFWSQGRITAYAEVKVSRITVISGLATILSEP